MMIEKMRRKALITSPQLNVQILIWILRAPAVEIPVHVLALEKKSRTHALVETAGSSEEGLAGSDYGSPVRYPCFLIE